MSVHAPEGSYERADEYPVVLDPVAQRAVLVPEKGLPLVRELFGILNRHRLTITSVARRSGVNISTICDWRSRRSPTLVNIEAVLNACGYELVIRKRGDVSDDV